MLYNGSGTNFTEEDLYKETLEELKLHLPALAKNLNLSAYDKRLYFDFINNLISDYESVLDIGTGAGKKLIDFTFIGKKAEGIEPSRMYNQVHREFGLNSSVGSLVDVNKQYDLVVLSHVLEHLTNIDQVIEKLSNITKRYLFIEVPGHAENLQSIQNAHKFYISVNTVNFFVLKNDFRLIKIDYASDAEFILALYEKSERSANFQFSHKNERELVKKVHKKYMKRYLIYKIMKLTRTEQAVVYLVRRFKDILKLRQCKN